MRSHVKSVLLPFLLLAGVLASLPAQATHARYGHISWEPRPDISETTVDFRVTVAFRRTYFGNLQIGSIFRPGWVNFGDGQRVRPDFEVIAMNAQENWVIGRALQPGMEPGYLRHTYSTPVRSNGDPWEINMSVCCRISSLRNSANSNFRIFATVDLLEQNHSPVSSLPPIVTCARGECQFSVPALDKDGDQLRWSLTPLNRSGIRRNPEGLILDGETGFIDWREGSANAALGLYALSVMIEDLDEHGEPRSEVVVDFIINLRDFVDNQPPAFDRPPTPEIGETIDAIVGQELVIDIQASDPDLDDEVFINNLGLPPAASFEVIEQGNPALARFSWQPEMQHIGEHLVTFTATDQKAASALPVPVVIRVSQPSISDVRVIDRVSAVDINIEESSFSVPPVSIDVENDTSVVEWFYPTFDAGQVEAIEFDVRLDNLQPGETRLVIHDLELNYRDVNGNPVVEKLGSRAVQVSESVMTLSTETDRIAYRPGETVIISSAVRNLDEVPAGGEVNLSVVDAQGFLVSDLGGFSVSLPGEQEQTLSGRDFPVGSTVAGDYRVRAELSNTQGWVVAVAEAPFAVVTESGEATSVASAVSTDKPRYGRWDNVAIQARLQNQAGNAELEATHNEIRVTNPDGVVLLQQAHELPSLAANGIEDYQFNLPLEGGADGTWRVDWINRDAISGAELARSQTDFLVEHIILQDLVGDVSVTHDRIFHTGGNACAYQVLNRAPEDGAVMEFAHSIVHVESEALISRQTRSASLGADETLEWDSTFDAMEQPYGGYACILEARLNDNWQVIASAGFEVLSPGVSSTLTTGERGRLLVLADAPRQCSALEDIHVGLDFEAELEGASRIEVNLRDADGRLLDSEVVNQFDVDINSGSGSVVDLAVNASASGEVRARIASLSGHLGKAHEIEVVVTRSWFLRSRKHWRIDTSCDRPFTVGELFEDVKLLAWHPWHGSDDLRLADPFGPVDGPDVETQTAFLEQLLTEQGWEYTLVHQADDFTREHRLGGYHGYLILSERPMLPWKVQKEVREAVFGGAGLILAGAHDRRNLWLEDALGIRVVGRHPWARELTLQDGNLGAGWSSPLPVRDKVQGISLRGARVLAEYGLYGDDLLSEWHWLDKGGFSLADITAFKRRAVTDYRFGHGRGLFFGFDLLLQATEAGHDSVYADLLRNSLLLVHPQTLRREPLAVLPLEVRLLNERGATSGRAELSLPPGAAMEVPGLFEPHGERWWFDFDLAEGEARETRPYVRLPELAGEQRFTLSVATDIDGQYLQQPEAELALLTDPQPSTGDTRAMLDQLAWRYWYRPAYRNAWLKFRLADEAMSAGHWYIAQGLLLTTADLLGESDDEDVVDARRQVGVHIRQVARQLATQ